MTNRIIGFALTTALAVVSHASAGTNAAYIYNMAVNTYKQAVADDGTNTMGQAKTTNAFNALKKPKDSGLMGCALASYTAAYNSASANLNNAKAVAVTYATDAGNFTLAQATYLNCGMTLDQAKACLKDADACHTDQNNFGSYLQNAQADVNTCTALINRYFGCTPFIIELF
jgi:hypothetical protein